MNEEEKYEPKISLPEGILITLLFVIIDGIEIVILFFALDDFWILDAISSAIFLYLFIKAIPPVYQLVAWIAELIPYLGALPLNTVGWLATWWVDAHPKSKVGQVISTAASYVPSGKSVAQKVEGGAVEVAEAGAKTATTATRIAEDTATVGRGAVTEMGETGSKAAKGIGGVPEEAFGMPKEPIEKVKGIMENLPEPELRAPEEKEYNEEDDSEFRKVA